MSLFSDAEHQFLAISEEDGDIETLPFLLACRQFIPFLDTLGPTAFAPVKADISGNIEVRDTVDMIISSSIPQRLMTKYETDKSSYDTLQKIVDDEISKNFQKDPTSCTIGLLWLNRYMPHPLTNSCYGNSLQGIKFHLPFPPECNRW
jgi:pleckstrin family protein A (phosphoinositide binding specific) protein 8